MTADEERAALVTGALWAAIQVTGSMSPAGARHFPAVFSPEWLAGLALPSRQKLPHGQPAAMPGAAPGGFERHAGAAALEAAYRSRPRTRIYEDIGWGQEDTWAALASRHLTRLAGGPRVTVTVYESAYGDQELGTHRDALLGVIVHAAGAKRWQAGAQAPVTLTAGDVLVVPKNLPHRVTTPAAPGYSVHVLFAVSRELPPGRPDDGKANVMTPAGPPRPNSQE